MLGKQAKAYVLYHSGALKMFEASEYHNHIFINNKPSGCVEKKKLLKGRVKETA